jgi:peptide/nickel transport system permease protein
MLAIPALIIASFMGVILASLAAHRPGGPFDVVLTSIILIVDSIPVFWLGQILIIIFAVKLQILPSYGMITLRNPPTGFGAVLDFLVHWILPGMAVAIVSMGLISRVARASLAETSTQDFVTTAQALGMSDRAVLWKHILPNAMIPVISVIGYNFGHAITGTIMTEAVFAWPGLGGLFVSSINSRDYPVLQGIFMLTAITVVFANLVTDLIYGLVDPRVRYGR